jgi:hypothetical protein
LGNGALSGRKSSKIYALWGKDNFWYISVRIPMVKGEKYLALVICNIWLMALGVIVSRVSLEDETTAL